MKIVLQNLTKIFPSRNKKSNDEVIAVNNFNFEIPDGKLIGLLGPSGCGKSTTLYMISGLQKPTSGKIFFGEDDVTALSTEKRGIGLVFQNYALYPHMTVLQNILFPLQNLTGADKMPKEKMIERAHEAARLVQIEELLDRKPSELSGGQQQRVAIARSLVKMPRVLLLDEPLSNLDARLRLQTREEIRRIQKETGITTVFVTHDQEEAMSISDMIVAAAQDVTIGIRPEGFVPDANGPLKCHLNNIEVMGRDMSVVSTHPASLNPVIRSIIDADHMPGLNQKTVRYTIKPHKLFIFNRESEERIRFEVK